jgi:hypothetical protein
MWDENDAYREAEAAAYQHGIGPCVNCGEHRADSSGYCSQECDDEDNARPGQPVDALVTDGYVFGTVASARTLFARREPAADLAAIELLNNLLAAVVAEER